MTATNHAITAANLALVTRQWWVLPIALLSHFVLDTLPHYGEPTIEAKDKRFKTVLAVDAIAFTMVFWLVVLTAGKYAPLAIASMFLAVLPDTVWAYRLYREKKEGKIPKRNFITDFHAKIQWGERPWGWVMEVSWFSAMLLIYGYLVVTFVID